MIRKEKSASSAAQFLTLQSGGVSDVFAAQQNALERLRELVATKLGAEVEHAPRHEGEIFLRRPVFTKVRTCN